MVARWQAALAFPTTIRCNSQFTGTPDFTFLRSVPTSVAEREFCRRSCCAAFVTEKEGFTKEVAVDDGLLLKEQNGALKERVQPVEGLPAQTKAPDLSFQLVELFNVERRSVQDYMNRAPEFIKSDGGPPRWFCPVECGRPPEDAPLLLFLPGLDGTGLGMIRHYESLGRMFEVRCLHIPVSDRTPAEGLIAFIEETLKAEKSSGKERPIYLVGDSLGGAFALAIAARNVSIDIVLVLANPATSFDRSQLQPLLPLLEFSPNEFFKTIPFLLSFTMAAVDQNLPAMEKMQALANSLVALLPTLPTLASIVPKDTLLWKIKLLKSTAMYANSRLHAIKAPVLVLASGKDQMLPSSEEAQRLKSMLKNCVVRYFKDSGHTLLLEDGIDLGLVIRGAKLYRKKRVFDAVYDYIYPTNKEFEEAYQKNRFLCQICSPVFFSKRKDGSIVRGLDGIPEEGPILLVGYHMLMGIELLPLVTEFLKRKQVIRGVAHPILFSESTQGSLPEPGYLDDVRIFGAIPATKKSFFKLMSRRESALLYPGGAREALHRKGEAYKLFWPKQSEFVRTAARFGFTIVPFGAVGEDDLVEILLDYNDLKQLPFYKTSDNVDQQTLQIRRGQSGEVGKQELHVPLLAPKLTGRMYFLFGKPFPTDGRERFLQAREESDKLYLEVKKEVEDCLSYLQQKREKDPYRSFLPRFFLESLWGGEWQAPTFNP